MVFTLNINAKGLDDLRKNFGGDVIKDLVNKAIKTSIILLDGESKKESPIDRGQLRAGFQSKFLPLKGILFNPTKYALFVQEGTRPHAPPWQPIKEYAERKGINPGALRYSIKRKGTKPNDYLGRAISKTERKIDQVFAKMTTTLISRLEK